MHDFLSLFLLLAGFVIGLGAVTVIDWHGFMGRHSPYWTEATIRTHKITKPLIWAGLTLAIIGGTWFYWGQPLTGIPLYHAIIAVALVLNGLFLSFVVSPALLQREKEGRAAELLPASLQKKIAASFVVSFLGWWGALVLLVSYLTASNAITFAPNPEEYRNAMLKEQCEKNEGRWLEQYKECEIDNREWCEANGGKFSSCNSACRHATGKNIVCTLQCVRVCKF